MFMFMNLLNLLNLLFHTFFLEIEVLFCFLPECICIGAPFKRDDIRSEQLAETAAAQNLCTITILHCMQAYDV